MPDIVQARLAWILLFYFTEKETDLYLVELDVILKGERGDLPGNKCQPFIVGIESRGNSKNKC